MSRRRPGGHRSGAVAFFILFVLAVLWRLRWVILAAAVIAAAVEITRWALKRHRATQAAERAQLAALRQRAEIQNDQALRGDPAGFFGAGPLPDPE